MVRYFLQALAAGLTFMLTASPALGQGVVIETIEIGSALEDKRDEYGARDLERIEADLREALQDALDDAGHAGSDAEASVFVSVVIEDAWPNRPTFAQMSDRPSLSYKSVSRGGARLSATLRDANGGDLGQVNYEWRTFNIAQSAYRSTWGDARRTIHRFSSRVADRITEVQPTG